MNSHHAIYLWLTAGVVFFGIMYAWSRYRSALHPMIIHGSLLLYGYAIGPALLLHQTDLESYFTESWQLEYVMIVNLLGMVSFTIGSCWKQEPLTKLFRGMPTVNVPLDARSRVLRLALLFGTIGAVAYWHSISNAGGFTSAYSRAKGGGWSSSGYIGEAPLLVYPAIMLLGLAARSGKRGMNILFCILGVLISLPHLFQGTFGGRRGPLFLVLSTMLMAVLTARQKRPSIPVVLGSFGVILLIVIVVWSQRQSWYIGSEREKNVTQESLFDKLVPLDDPAGHYYVFAAGLILNTKYHQKFDWGRDYLVTLFIRPIPHQIWPTKYEDTVGINNGVDSIQDWKESVGWEPLSGSASGFIADAYVELSWGYILIAYYMGRFFAWIWRNAILRGGIWSVLFMEICILGVYLPTQSLSAFWHRFLFMSIPMWLIWRYYIETPQSVK
jgi:hypothetical protein